MNIRFATKKDKDAVSKLLDELSKEINKKRGYSPHNAEAQKVGGKIFDDVVSRKDTLIFVAEEGNELLGLITFYLLPNIRHGWHRGHIEDIVVSQSVRSKGIGSQLFLTYAKSQ